ncbi:MAG: hypothetical protein ACU837_10645 [Gammaproteobacteria bacterium]
MNESPKFDLENLKNIILQLKVPLAFDVLNSFKKEDTGTPYFVVINNIPAKIHFERVYDFKYKGEFNIAPYSKIPEDRNSLLSYMNAQIWFDKQTFGSMCIKKETLSEVEPHLLEIAIQYLNKFIKAYKSVTKDYWLRPIVRNDIFNYQCYLVDWAENHISISYAIAGHHCVQFNGGKEFKLTDSQDNLLRNRLVGNEYDFRNELWLDMQNNFSLGYYNIALLQSITAFESFVYFELKKGLSKTKLDKIKKKADCGCMAGITEVCTRGIKQHYEVDFGITQEFLDLKNKALKYRNDIVHGEILEQIDQNICKSGIEAVIAAQNYLISNVFYKNSTD